MKAHIVVPARFASERLPGKPLADIGGAPMIVRVMERVAQVPDTDAIAAVDDERVYAAVTEAGFAAMMTSQDHASGSDRVMEVATGAGWRDDELVVNVQGDEPFVPPQLVADLIRLLAERSELGLATVCESHTDSIALKDPNVVKVVRSTDGLALYFSRAPIPHRRDGEGLSPLPWLRHIGMYAFTVQGLRRFTSLSPSPLEMCERLEQLRWLEAGMNIALLETSVSVPAGVDTESDLQAANSRFQAD